MAKAATTLCSMPEAIQLNVLAEPLAMCSEDPTTGFTRTGKCSKHPADTGKHFVCVKITDEFLRYSASKGNDLSTPIPEYDFPGLIAGDQWCLCAARWQQALEDGCAPMVVLAATHISTLEICDLQDLMRHAIDSHRVN